MVPNVEIHVQVWILYPPCLMTYQIVKVVGLSSLPVNETRNAVDRRMIGSQDQDLVKDCLVDFDVH